MSEKVITRIGPCGLTTERDGEVLGYWQEATCAEWAEAVDVAGGLAALTAWSGFTNLEDSDRGPAFVFTEWGTDYVPVVADGGHPSQRKTGIGPCRMTHAIFVPASPTPSEGE